MNRFVVIEEKIKGQVFGSSEVKQVKMLQCYETLALGSIPT